MVTDVLNLTHNYLHAKYDVNEMEVISNELIKIAALNGFNFKLNDENKIKAYDELQQVLAKLNEKESFRKHKGVYYTPNDVVQFILSQSIKSLFGKQKVRELNDISLSDIPYKSFCVTKTVFDPTCGSGEYLLAALEMKLDMLDKNVSRINHDIILKTVSTIFGNDINRESITITKIRLFLCVLNRYGANKIKGLFDVLNQNFYSYDYVTTNPNAQKKYHLIVGNPPYVEDHKSGLVLENKYGNIYANVLKNSVAQLEPNGSIGFIIPLSYISTPRMKRIRDDLNDGLAEQYLLSYADRPDCLFNSVHQKLCLLIGKQKKSNKCIYTGNYQYWYKEERASLFKNTEVIENKFLDGDFIPKLGTPTDTLIFRKVTQRDNLKSIYDVSRSGSESVYVNRRATFWMKAFREPIIHPEFKVFSFNSAGEADYCYCLINSSLFWWYWIAVSDCWHVSTKLNDFKAPAIDDYTLAKSLAKSLLNRLEETKVHVGTKQTAYEYKHRDCIKEIHDIDDFINDLYGLTVEESDYIKSFAFSYRTSAGAKKNASN